MRQDTMTCVFCSITRTGDTAYLGSVGWCWFTGYNPERTECCPTCAFSRKPEWNSLLFDSRRTPDEKSCLSPALPVGK